MKFIISSVKQSVIKKVINLKIVSIEKFYSIFFSFLKVILVKTWITFAFPT